MVDKLSGLGSLGPLHNRELQKTGRTQPGGKDFKQVMSDFLTQANDSQLNADEAVKKFASGEIKDLHQIMVVLAEADISFKMMMDIRNKLVESYREIMRMQL